MHYKELGVLSVEMQQLRAENLALFFNLIGRIEAILDDMADAHAKNISTPAKSEQMREVMTGATQLCDVLDLPLSRKTGDRMLAALSKGLAPKATLDHLIEFRRRSIDELSLQQCYFQVSQEAAKYFENLAPFGNEVTARFPSAAFDIEEASKCFAVGRYTACVMHLQRVIEIALKAFAALLKIELRGNQNWGALLKLTESRIAERNKTVAGKSAWTSKKEQAFCESIQSFLNAVRIAWRNPSMHAGAKYTEDESRNVFQATKGFMIHLATHLDDSGTFYDSSGI